MAEERGKTKLAEEMRKRLDEVIERDGITKVSERYKVYETPLLRAAKGGTIQRGTEALILNGLAKEEAEKR